MQIDDIHNYKIYREHTTGVPAGFKAIKQGMTVTDQDNTDGAYTVTDKGDEAGWIFCEKNTRDIGSWAQVVPVKATDDVGTIKPILGQALGADSTYAAKTVVTTPTTNDFSKAAAVDGSLPANGDVGLVVQCLNQDSHEQLFFPAASTVIKVDHLSPGDVSTKIHDVKVDGTLDPANIGKTKDFLRVYDNFVHLLTTAKFYQDTAKRGPLSFDAAAFPSLVPPDETPFTVETKLAWDSASSKFRWYTSIGGGEGTTLARVRFDWNTETGDLSEAETVTYQGETTYYDGTTGSVYNATGDLLWITLAKSKTVQFETAGTGTIFELQKIKDLVDRGGIIRDLYRIKGVREDAGKRITHLHATQKTTANVLGTFLSSELLAEPWQNWNSAKITTTIDNVEKENNVLVRLPDEWDLSGPEQFEYLENSDMGRGWPLFFRPIRPVPSDLEIPQYQSAVKINALSIATYRRKI